LLEGLYYLIPKQPELMGKVTYGTYSGKGIVDFSLLSVHFYFNLMMIFKRYYVLIKKDFLE